MNAITLKMSVEGRVASVFIASSLAVLIIGVLTYLRKQIPWLEVYAPAGTFSGIWFYSYIVWALVWVIAYFVLRDKERVGSLKQWLVIFLSSVAIATVLIEISLKWSLIFK